MLQRELLLLTNQDLFQHAKTKLIGKLKQIGGIISNILLYISG